MHCIHWLEIHTDSIYPVIHVFCFHVALCVSIFQLSFKRQADEMTRECRAAVARFGAVGYSSNLEHHEYYCPIKLEPTQRQFVVERSILHVQQ